MKIKQSWYNHLLNFLAVIIGVYLGFYINQKAIENKERKESIALMKSMLTDLAEDIEVYEEYQIPENRKQQENIGKLIEMLVKDSLDGFGVQLSLVFQVENFKPTTSTYSSMKSSDKMRLINNLDLQKNISDYYEGTAEESSRKGEFQVDYFTDELLTWLTRNVDLTTMELLTKNELIQLRNKLIIYESLVEQKVGAYEMNVESSKELKNRIESVVSSK